MRERTLPALRPPPIHWRLIGLTLWVATNAGLLLWLGWSAQGSDWALWRALPQAIIEGRIYDVPGYVWSPFAVPVSAGVAITGFWPQAVAQVAFVLLLRDRLIALLLFTSFWFWPAVIGGNPLFTLTLVAAIGAFRGGRHWTLTYLIVTILAPRPLQLPLLAWILWQRSEWRLPFGAMFIGHALAVLATGYLGPWIANVRAQAEHPSLWYVRWLTDIPLALRAIAAALLTWRGRPGWAGLVVSPYILSGYLLFPLMELRSVDLLHEEGCHATDSSR